MAHCPECDASISVQGLMIGEIIYCPDCNAELEVLSVEQPAVGLVVGFPYLAPFEELKLKKP